MELDRGNGLEAMYKLIAGVGTFVFALGVGITTQCAVSNQRNLEKKCESAHVQMYLQQHQKIGDDVYADISTRCEDFKPKTCLDTLTTYASELQSSYPNGYLEAMCYNVTQ